MENSTVSVEEISFYDNVQSNDKNKVKDAVWKIKFYSNTKNSHLFFCVCALNKIENAG